MYKTFKMNLAGRELTCYIGRVCAQANGAVMLQYGDTMVLQITYKPTIKARLEFDYKFFRKSDGQLMTEASTTQHFVRIENKELQFSRPDFYIEWQEKWNVFTND